MGRKINNIWVFVATDAEGDEGVMAFSAGPFMMPMVASDEARVVQLRDVADQISKQTGTQYEIRQFTRGEPQHVH